LPRVSWRLLGLPPFGVFVSESLLLRAGFLAGRPWVTGDDPGPAVSPSSCHARAPEPILLWRASARSSRRRRPAASAAASAQSGDPPRDRRGSSGSAVAPARAGVGDRRPHDASRDAARPRSHGLHLERNRRGAPSPRAARRRGADARDDLLVRALPDPGERPAERATGLVRGRVALGRSAHATSSWKVRPGSPRMIRPSRRSPLSPHPASRYEARDPGSARLARPGTPRPAPARAPRLLAGDLPSAAQGRRAARRLHGQGVKPFLSSRWRRGIFEIPVGPVHAGIIEPGHFRFQASTGETIINMKARCIYTHKGTEKLFDGADTRRGHRPGGADFGRHSGRPSAGLLQAIETLAGVQAAAAGPVPARRPSGPASGFTTRRRLRRHRE